MRIYELRKTASNNKKYKYIYELIIDGRVFSTRKSVKEYAGCMVDGKAHHFFTDVDIAGLLINNPGLLSTERPSAIALTFDGLLKLSDLGV